MYLTFGLMTFIPLLLFLIHLIIEPYRNKYDKERIFFRRWHKLKKRYPSSFKRAGRYRISYTILNINKEDSIRISSFGNLFIKDGSTDDYTKGIELLDKFENDKLLKGE